MNIGLIGLLKEPLVFLIVVALVLFGFVLHNVVQVLVAAALGDKTAKNSGFASTDPRIHLDPLSFVFLILLGFAVPRSIPVNSRSFAGKGRMEGFVWLSGPIAMIIWSFILYFIARLLIDFAPIQTEIIIQGLTGASLISLRITAVYLVPVPPLDGARALYSVGDYNTRRFLNQLASYGSIGFIIIFFVLSYVGVLGVISSAIFTVFSQIISIFGL